MRVRRREGRRNDQASSSSFTSTTRRQFYASKFSQTDRGDAKTCFRLVGRGHMRKTERLISISNRKENKQKVLNRERRKTSRKNKEEDKGVKKDRTWYQARGEGIVAKS